MNMCCVFLIILTNFGENSLFLNGHLCSALLYLVKNCFLQAAQNAVICKDDCDRDGNGELG